MAGRSGSGVAAIRLARLLASISLAALLLPPQAVFAQTASSPAPSAGPLQQSITFAIPPQSLSTAIVAFSRAAGIDLVFDGAVPRGARTSGVSGTFTVHEGVNRLLAGTGLTARFTNARTVQIVNPSAAGGAAGAAPAGAISLDTIDVQGADNPNSTMSLPPAYAGGQIARGGQLGMLGNRDMMNTPFNQTVYTRKLIENQQARNLGDVLNNDPSVVKAFDTGGGFPRDQWSIRGVGANAQNVAFGGLFGIAQTRSIAMATEAIERVEVLKGASALLNGLPPSQITNLGTVNLVPKRAGDEPLIAFTPNYAMNSQFGGHLDMGQRFGDNKEFGVRFNGVYRNGDTPILHNSRETRLTTLGFDYRGETVRLSLDAGYQYQDMRGVREVIYVDSGVPIPSPPKNTANWGQPWQSYKAEHKYVTTRGEWDINESVTAFAAVGRSTVGTKTIENYVSVTDAAGTLLSAWYPYGGVDYIQTATATAGLRGRLQTGPVNHALALAAAWANEEAGFNPGNSVSPLPASNLYNPVFYPQPDFGNPGDPRNVPKSNGNENLGFALADTMSILNERVQLHAWREASERQAGFLHGRFQL